MQAKIIAPKQIILFRGTLEIITYPEKEPFYTAFYDHIQNFFQAHGFICNNAFYGAQELSSALITPNTNILIGHSMGALALIRTYASLFHPNVKHLLFFDPAFEFYNLIKFHNVSIHIFISKYWSVDYWRFYGSTLGTVHLLNDNHYFSSSLPYITDVLEKTI